MPYETPLLLTLESYEDLSPSTRHFVFSANQDVKFIPGQFITLHWVVDGQAIHRNYSLANYGGYSDAHPKRLELAAAYVDKGFASQKLFSMQINETLQATGPFGRLILREELVNRYLLIATGAGVTPYRTMLNELEKRMDANADLEALLWFGVRTAEDALYKNDFIAFAKTHPRFTFKLYYSREEVNNSEYEYSGRVTQALDDTLTISPEKDVAYLCGNPMMVEEMRAQLFQKGLPSHRIRPEKYISPKEKRRL